jgi:hypothetical protein
MKTRLTLLGALLAAAFAVQAQGVRPPPLPPGSNLVNVEAGLNPREKKRSERAHHHKGHHRKDMHRDDSDRGRGNDKDRDDRGNKGGKDDKGGRK